MRLQKGVTAALVPGAVGGRGVRSNIGRRQDAIIALITLFNAKIKPFSAVFRNALNSVLNNSRFAAVIASFLHASLAAFGCKAFLLDSKPPYMGYGYFLIRIIML